MYMAKCEYWKLNRYLVYMSFVQMVEMKPTYQKQNGRENLVLMS
jgi:hypothetical protein